MPRVIKRIRVRRNLMAAAIIKKTRKGRKFENEDQSENIHSNLCADPVAKKQLGCSALVEIHNNLNVPAEPLELQPCVDPVLCATYLRVQSKRSDELPEEGLSSQLTDNVDELLITSEEKQTMEEKQIGRRIINLSFFTKKLLDFCNHGPLACPASGIILTGEKKNGLISKFTFKCRMCNVISVIENDNCEQNYLNLNACAVSGTVATGCGRSQLEELFSAMDLPSLSEHVYNLNHSLISKHWEKVAMENMMEAGKREKELAIAARKVTKEGYGVVDVEVDGCWSKRSYKKNYSALSGAATIIGRNTKEILFLGIKNKYCQICAMTTRGEKPKDHLCFKNYSGPSTAMESTILVEGFKQSIEQHGLVYGRLISDGDSSTYSKILEARPYQNITVEKVECRNHVMRNFCNKLQALTTDTKYLLKHRKCVNIKSIMAIRCTIIKSIKKHKVNSDVQLLFDDILRSHPHAFGDHSQCKPYFCTKVGEVNKDKVPNNFFSSALWQRINFIVQGVAAHSRSLIYDVDSNRVENFHSVVAKFVGGKRINYSKKNSYQLRVHAAAVAFNAKKSISRLYKSINGGKSPTGKLKCLEDGRIKKAKYNTQTRKPRKRLITQKSDGKDYGEKCSKPDLDENMYERVKLNFLENLRKNDEELATIQKNTILQSESGEWMELRRSLLTASNFGKIIKRRPDTSCGNTVKDLLYKATNLGHVAAIKHGHEHEEKALIQLSSQMNINISKCGLFIDKELPFLGATPDGLCDDDTIVEVKCPITANVIGVDEAIKQKKVTFWKYNKKNASQEINKTHNWYYQVQGQLRVTQRKKCVFAVWANESSPLKVEIIEKDDEFWHHKMHEKLTRFYMDCILPELIDPRHSRNLPIKDPIYIQEAIKKKKEKVKKSNSTLNANEDK